MSRTYIQAMGTKSHNNVNYRSVGERTYVQAMDTDQITVRTSRIL
jgi:hypothetical protein